MVDFLSYFLVLHKLITAVCYTKDKINTSDFSHLSLGWRKPEESEKTIDMSQVTDKLYQIPRPDPDWNSPYQW